MSPVIEIKIWLEKQKQDIYHRKKKRLI